MRIEHVAVWVMDLEQTRTFYETHFDAVAGARYENSAKQFSSYFLTFPDGGARLEIMHSPSRVLATENGIGSMHFAVSVGSKAAVDAFFARLSAAGHGARAPRTTGDGYYEAVVNDPDGLEIEITV